MSLRVLLADDSAAIKKVIQLSLQDYGVEIRTVNSGKDVLDVARSFVPDIAFVDVLLPHKTGYEIAQEMKKDNALGKTPIVMLWSSFMALDEGKFKLSGADEKLEKPFEVNHIRSIVNKYVPKTQSSPLGKHLEFPALDFDFSEQTSSKTNVEFEISEAESPNQGAGGNWNMDSFDQIPSFDSTQPSAAEAPIPEPEANPSHSGLTNPAWSSDSEWVRRDLGKFQVPIPEENADESTVNFQYNEKDIKSLDFLLKPNQEAAKPVDAPVPKASKPEESKKATTPSFTDHLAAASAEPVKEVTAVTLSKELQGAMTDPTATTQAPPIDSSMIESAVKSMTPQIEALIRKAVQEAVWKIVPEIASNMIKEELARLTSEDK
ncbi:MAG: response regulator [Oligoflexia bacterium]|nr:response regulator [Oligoflexia bacterium]